MNPLPSSTTALIAHAAGWTLLHFLWQGALVALGYSKPFEAALERIATAVVNKAAVLSKRLGR